MNDTKINGVTIRFCPTSVTEIPFRGYRAPPKWSVFRITSKGKKTYIGEVARITKKRWSATPSEGPTLTFFQTRKKAVAWILYEGGRHG